METNSHRTDNAGNVQAEDNYAANQHDPAPAPEAINEPDDKPASKTIWIAVVLAIVVMAIVYFLFVY